MREITTIAALRSELDHERSSGATVGLVPTMGFLHDGHASLIRRAASENDVVVVSVYVNPLQFAANEDLGAYPRDLDGDRAAASVAGAQLLFLPEAREMVPAAMATTVTVTGVSEGMEGSSRPSHFAGVATIVTKLFAIAGPCRAYFGEKDFQQLAVIATMARDLALPVEVIGCEIVREPDGLARSSRNVYLTPLERAAAPAIHRALLAGQRVLSETSERNATVHSVLDTVRQALDEEPLIDLEYVELVDPVTLSPVIELDRPARLCVAARLGRARLIDNLAISPPSGFGDQLDASTCGTST